MLQSLQTGTVESKVAGARWAKDNLAPAWFEMIDGAWVDSDENDATLDFDIARMVRSHTSYTKFIHRLGHDPMTNLESTSTNDKAVWYTDLDPNAEYGYSYFDLQHRTEIQIPALRALTLAVEAAALRLQRRPIRSALLDGFGLIAFASLTPILFVLIYGMVV